MSRIKIYALGGLGEDGKNMYCIDVDEKIFVLDAGLKYPSLELFGVDSIIPDFSYLEKNKHRIAGIFLSHGHEDHIGALPRFLKLINVPIYASNFTLEIVKDSLVEEGHKLEDYNFFTLSSKNTLTFGNVRVDAYRVTHSIPETIGIAITTKDGVIVYAPDYNFDQNVDQMYKTEFDKLSKISSKKVIALLTESLGAERVGHTHSSQSLDYTLNQAFYQAEERVIVSAFSTDLLRIQKIIDIALKNEREIAIIGRKTQRIVDIAVNQGYLKIPAEKLVNLKFITDKNKNLLPNAVVLVTGDRHEPFYMLQRMVKKLDRLVHINNKDTVILMTPPIPGTEKIAARTLDVLYRNDANVIKINKTILPPSHASSEDIKLLINLLNPKYVIPVIGEYRHQYALKNVAIQLGYKENDIKMLENGYVLEINNGKVISESERVEAGEILVDGILDGDLSDVVLRDRELLAQDGVLLVIANVDARAKKVVTVPEIVSRGFIYMKDNEELIKDVQEIFYKVSEKIFTNKYVEWRQFKDAVKDEVSKYLYRSTKRRPIIIPVIIDTQI